MKQFDKLQAVVRRNSIPIFILLLVIPLLAYLSAAWWVFAISVLLTFFIWREPDSNSTYLEQAIPDYLAPEVLKGYIDQLENPLVFINADGQVSHFSKSAKQIFSGLNLGIPLVNLTRNPRLHEIIREVFEDAQFRQAILEVNSTSDRFIEVSVSAVEEPYAQILKADVKIEFNDVTSRRLAEQSRKDFIANASHELRTPLAVIQGGLETIDTHSEDPEAFRIFVPTMKNEAQRMATIIDDLLLLSQIDAQEKILDTENVAVRQVFEDLLRLYETQSSKSINRVLCDFPDSNLTVLADKEQFMRMLINLVDNALKYGSEGKDVRVYLAKQNPRFKGMIGITVENSGEGIPKNEIGRLTERFYRVNSKGKEGTGLGLAIVKQILNRHGGELQIQSEANQGSKFTIWLRKSERLKNS